MLAVMVALGALAWPTMVGRLELRRLQANADDIRARWIGARVSAMQHETVYAYRYVPSEGRWQLGPWDAAAGGMTAASTALGAAAGDAGSLDAANAPDETIEGALRDECIFVEGTKLSTARELWYEPDGSGGSLSVQWASPILFYPDGTTSTATVYLTGRDGENAIRLDLRGLTGTTTVSQIATLEELKT